MTLPQNDSPNRSGAISKTDWKLSTASTSSTSLSNAEDRLGFAQSTGVPLLSRTWPTIGAESPDVLIRREYHHYRPRPPRSRYVQIPWFSTAVQLDDSAFVRFFNTPSCPLRARIGREPVLFKNDDDDGLIHLGSDNKKHNGKGVFSFDKWAATGSTSNPLCGIQRQPFIILVVPGAKTVLGASTQK